MHIVQRWLLLSDAVDNCYYNSDVVHLGSIGDEAKREKNDKELVNRVKLEEE